jgi:predicted ester cyclase
LPNLQTRIDDLIVDEKAQKVAIRWTATGINERRYLGAGPTMKSTEIRGIEIIEVRAGRIIRRWGEWDVTGHVRRD